MREAADIPPSIEDVLLHSMIQRWQRYFRELRRCKRSFSEDAVHDLRVATRRLISTLMIVALVLPDPRTRRLQRRLKRLFDALSPLRDTQVQLLALSAKITEYPELEILVTTLKVRERNLMNAAAKRIERLDTLVLSGMMRGLKYSLRKHFLHPAMGTAAVAAMLGAAASRFAAAVWTKEHIVATRPRTIHRGRVAFKKFRYTLEAMAPMLPALGKEQLKAMDAYQTRMGNIQDAEVLITMVRRFAERRTPAFRRKLSRFRRDSFAQKKNLIEAYTQSADELYSFSNPLHHFR